MALIQNEKVPNLDIFICFTLFFLITARNDSRTNELDLDVIRALEEIFFIISLFPKPMYESVYQYKLIA